MNGVERMRGTSAEASSAQFWDGRAANVEALGDTLVAMPWRYQ